MKAVTLTINGKSMVLTKELRQAFSREHALQCGYCTPGMLVSARDLALRAESAGEREFASP